MKRVFQLCTVALVTAFAMAFSLKAADLIVEENGVLPNYGTIQDAMNAASDGDRVFVKNKAGNVPYQENVTINVSVELLPFDANGTYYVQGSYTLQPVLGRIITIIGMNNQNGSITMAANSPAGTPSQVNIFNCYLASGSISISGTNIISQISGNQLVSGSITTRYATVTGNLLNAGSIIMNSASSLTSQDTLYIVGNRILNNGRVTYSNPQHYFHIANNAITSGNQVYPIYVTAMKAGSGKNMIVNNSLRALNSSSRGMYVTTVPTGATLEVQNNALQGSTSGTSYRWYINSIQSGAFVGLYFNKYTGFDNNSVCTGCALTGNASASLSINSTTGECSSVPACVDGGNPSTDFTDLDLTTNDVGTKGGSFNFNNFFPIFTGSSRVYLVRTPRTVLQTSTIRAEADAYDR